MDAHMSQFFRQLSNLTMACLLMAWVAGCSTLDTRSGERVNTGSATGGTYKVGEPYQIKGVWYYPNEDYSYDETGIASWYGPNFHGNRTANGERYDQNELTAAHPTLPMPSLARVTNLDNGRSIVVRINDRGPFARERLIDLSRRSAQLLGFEKRGTAKVRVQVLADESRAIAAAAKRYGSEQASYAYAAKGAGKQAARDRDDDLVVTAAPRTKVTTENLADATPLPRSVPQVSKPTSAPAVKTAAIEAEPAKLPVVTRVAVKSDPQIYVQAGAFSQSENAEKLSRRLSRIAPAAINRTEVDRTAFYRVRLGPLADVGRAKAVLRQVAAAGVAEPRIIVD
jgi:rare lipoprotein A